MQNIQKEFPNVKFAILSIDKNKKTITSNVKKFKINNDITLENANYREAIRNFLDNRNLKSLIKTELVPVTYIIKNGNIVYKE